MKFKFSQIVASSLVVSSIFVVGCNKVESNNVTDASTDESIVQEYKKTIEELQELVSQLKNDSNEIKENTHYYEVENYEQKYDIEDLKKRNLLGDLETIDIYSNKNIDNTNEFEPIDSIEISTQLSKEEKLFLLCDKMEEALKKESGKEIAFHIEDVIDEKYAVVSAVEKHPMHSYFYRKKEIEYTLNQVELKDGWFDKVRVVYDSHTTSI